MKQTRTLGSVALVAVTALVACKVYDEGLLDSGNEIRSGGGGDDGDGTGARSSGGGTGGQTGGGTGGAADPGDAGAGGDAEAGEGGAAGADAGAGGGGTGGAALGGDAGTGGGGTGGSGAAAAGGSGGTGAATGVGGGGGTGGGGTGGTEGGGGGTGGVEAGGSAGIAAAGEAGAGGSSGAGAGAGGGAGEEGTGGGQPACLGAAGGTFTLDMIHDMENGTTFINDHEDRTGSWYRRPATGGTWDPAPAARAIPEGPRELADGTTSANALQVGASGFTVEVEFGVQPGMSLNAPYDASAYDGVVFWARGSATEPGGGDDRLDFILFTAPVLPPSAGGTCAEATDECYDGHHYDVWLTSEWQQYIVAFCDIRQHGWGTPVGAIDPSQLIELRFQADPGTLFSVWIDDLAFFTYAPP